MKKEQRLKVILYNALVLLIDETFEQYDDESEWFAMFQNEIGCTAEELAEYGIKITVGGKFVKLSNNLNNKEIIK